MRAAAAVVDPACKLYSTASLTKTLTLVTDLTESVCA